LPIEEHPPISIISAVTDHSNETITDQFNDTVRKNTDQNNSNSNFEFDKNDDLITMKLKLKQQLEQKLFESINTNNIKDLDNEECKSKKSTTTANEKPLLLMKKKYKSTSSSGAKSSKKKISHKKSKNDRIILSSRDEDEIENHNDENVEEKYAEYVNGEGCNYDEAALRRRSDRIKVIENKKQTSRELELNEKLKQCYSNAYCVSKTVSMIELMDAETREKIPWPKDYEKIEENLYVTKKKRKNRNKKEAKRMVCDCMTSAQEREMGIRACGTDCLNRLLLIECGSRCPCGEYCTNRNFKLKNNAPIIPFKTEIKGWGIKSNTGLKSNTFLIEYVGEIIGLKEFKRRCEKYSEQNNEHFYFMSLQNDLFIDATRKGNMSRFFNHR
jgi:hypothetical protein